MEVSVHEAKTNLSKLLEAVGRGDRVIITRHGVPTAELVPARRKAVKIGTLKGKVSPPPDEFFQPLSEEELRDWEGN
ncbi:MAG: type II toxin-antitoxin system prevent-host-death family antitoxin [Pseudomonadota bacterium]